MTPREGNQSLRIAIRGIQNEAIYNAICFMAQEGWLADGLYADMSDEGDVLIKRHDSDMRVVLVGRSE